VPKATVICYLSSLVFYGMEYSEMLVLKNVDVNAYDYSIYVSLATAYLVLTIFLAITGSLFFYVKTIKDQEIIGSDNRRRASTPEKKARLPQPMYGVDLERRMSS